jgi:hypothetical protein
MSTLRDLSVTKLTLDYGDGCESVKRERRPKGLKTERRKGFV